jgi:hypothetical protein
VEEDENEKQKRKEEKRKIQVQDNKHTVRLLLEIRLYRPKMFSLSPRKAPSFYRN